jgi:hypothetical protein
MKVIFPIRSARKSTNDNSGDHRLTKATVSPK